MMNLDANKFNHINIASAHILLGVCLSLCDSNPWKALACFENAIQVCGPQYEKLQDSFEDVQQYNDIMAIALFDSANQYCRMGMHEFQQNMLNLVVEMMESQNQSSIKRYKSTFFLFLIFTFLNI